MQDQIAVVVFHGLAGRRQAGARSNMALRTALKEKRSEMLASGLPRVSNAPARNGGDRHARPPQTQEQLPPP
eukprot:8324146-Lingulodinium_polyedra.AAC.1